MTKNIKKITLSLTASAVLVGNAFALDPAITNFGYVGGSNIPISIFDASNPTKKKSIGGLSYSAATAIDPTGKVFYFTDFVNNNVKTFNALTGAVIGTSITVGNPMGITLNSVDSKAYVSNANSNTVSVIDTTTNTVTNTIAVGNGPDGITLSPDRSKVFVNNAVSQTVSIINTATNFVTATVSVGGGGGGITFNSDGSKAYVVNWWSNTVSVIDTTSNTVTATITVGNGPLSIALSHDGSKAYVANGTTSTVSIIDTATNTVTTTLTGLNSVYGISISPDGSTLYVRSSSGEQLYTIDTTTNTITTYTGFGTGSSYNFSPFISPNLITGTLSVASAADMLTKGFSNYVNFAGGTLRATGSFTLSNPIYLHDAFNLTYDDTSTFTTVAGGTVDTNSYDVEFSGEVSGVGGLTKTGAGVLTLSGTNTYSGGTTITGGLINFATANNFGSGNITLNGGGLQWASGTTIDISNKLNAIGAGGATFDTNSNDATLASVLSGTGGVSKTGTGTLTLSGTNTYSGDTTVSAGTLSLTGGGAIIDTGVVSVASGATLNIATSETVGSVAGAGAITLGADLTTGGANTNDTLSGIISGAGALNKSGTGTLTLSGVNTYSGGTTISAGTLKGNTASLQGNITNNATVEFAQASDGTFADIISGSGGVVKSDTGILTLSGTNTYSGGTTVNSGLINFAAANNFGSGNITLNGGGLQWNANTLDISATLTALGASGATFDTNGNDVTLASVLSGTGGVTKAGAGILTLSGTNTYSGGTTINTGTLKGNTASLQGNITNNAALEFAQASDGTFASIISGSGGVVKSDTGILTLSGTNTYSGGTTVSAGTLKGNTASLQGNITNNAAVEFAQASDGTFASIISGTGALTKSGSGALTLSGTNSYSGATTVNAGTLNITGDSQSSAFSVNSGATLSGSGSVGSLHIASGATLAPSGTSTLNVAGNLTIDAGSTVAINSYANGTNSKVVASGSATINGGAVNITAGAGSWNNSTVYTVLSANALTGTFSGVTDNLAFLDPTLSYEANAVKLTLTRNDVSYADVVVVPAPAPTPIPEPVVTPEPIPEPTPTPAPEPVVTPEPVPTPKFSYLTVAQTNSMQVARVLDNALASANQDMQQLYTSLNSMSAAQARDAISQLNGTTIGSMANTSPAQGRTFTLSLNNRMSSTSGSSGIGLASLAFADNGDMAQTFRHLADAGAIGENGFIEPQKIDDSEVWVRAVGGRTVSDADSSRNIDKSTTTTGGIQTGIDKKDGEWIFGGSFGYLSSNISKVDMDGKINSYQLGFYTAKDTKEYRISLSAVGGKYNNETSRLTPTGTASADFGGTALSAEMRATYKMPLNKRWSIEPSLGGWIQRYAQDSYSENGAIGANLAIDKATFTTQALTSELKLVHLFKDNKEYKGSFEIGIGYTKEFGDISAPLVGRFSAAPTAGSFSIASADRGSDMLTGLIGADTSLTTNIKLFALINAMLRKNEESYNAVAGFKLSF